MDALMDEWMFVCMYVYSIRVYVLTCMRVYVCSYACVYG